ncbi:endonuclease/exonuclease/phosphatase [bacterium]|nr:endonuclease/exonuclease/phosphatase [bacterium]
MKTHYVAWWNVENLFDINNAPGRPEWLQSKLKSELEGWTTQVRDKKISRLVSIITQMNNGAGPDLLGVCEVENKTVMDLLVASLAPLGRAYQVAHHDASDARGIDVGFIYDSAKFTAEQEFFHVIQKRSATRDLYQVNFRTADGNLLIAIGNHWPSRSGGEWESEPYRMMAGETLAYWHERIRDIVGTNANVLAMGDFNDEPFNRSMTFYALSGNSREKVTNARSARMFNLMWPFCGAGIGTHYYDNFPNVLDQFIVAKGLLTGNEGLQIKKAADGSYPVAVERFPEMVSDGDYPAPIRFGRPSAAGFNQNGFSDHYPISVLVSE